MSEKNVLIITYYWPPSGGSGVQRWLKFVKYLPSLGWTPYVFTPENPAVQANDESLLADVPAEAEVIRLPIWEPYRSFEKLTGAFGNKKNSQSAVSKSKGIGGRIILWMRGNLLVPDPRRFWIRPSVSFLSDFLIEKRIKTIITTGPPHSMHLIGLRLKKKLPHLKWIADFRDPWSTWGLLETLQVGGLAHRLHRRLEKQVLTNADTVVTITSFYKKQFERISGRPVHLIPNGYDETDFDGFSPQRPEKFVMRHVGIVNERCNPRPFMLALKEKCMTDTQFMKAVEVEFVGDVHSDFMAFVAADKILKQVTVFTPAVSHNQLLEIYRTSAVHLLILHGYKDAEGYLPGKLFEYLAAGIPVLGVGPSKGDAAVFLRDTGLGSMIDPENREGILNSLDENFNRWSSNAPLPAVRGAERFSRRGLAASLAELLG